MGTTSYSTTVRGWLMVGEQRLELARVGPHSCTVRQAIDSPPTEAELFVSVDGDVERRTVFLPNGISRESTTIAMRLDGSTG